MGKNIFPTLIIWIAIQFTGCVKIINEDITSKETKLVINSVIAPDSIFTVNISRTFNIFDDESSNNLPFVDSATVNVYEDNNFLFQLEPDGFGYYKKYFYPQVNKKYRIEVFSKKYGNASSTATIPIKVNHEKFDTMFYEYEEYGQKYVDFMAEIIYKDPESEDNFYMLSAKALYKDDMGYEGIYRLSLYVPENESELFDVSYNELLWSDKFTNGNQVTITFSYFTMYYETIDISKNIDSIDIEFYFKSVSKDYYAYLKSVNLFYETNNSDPFMQPVVIYSNIENGYGIFSSYDTDTIKLRLPYGNKIFKKGEE
jgi:hypothetical protein